MRKERDMKTWIKGTNVIKLFAALIYEWTNLVFVPWGRFMALPTNIELGWKGFPRTNTLAYYEHS